MENATHTRNSVLDIARIIAALAVVMIHCCASFVMDYEPHMREFAVANVLISISRIGVPLFLMISGALFLDENKKVTIKSVLSKNVKNLAIITIAWAFIYAVVYDVFYQLLIGKKIQVKHVLGGILEGYYHMWYLYMIIGLYVITPFLKTFVSKKNKSMVLFYILVSFVVQFLLPTIDRICILYWNMDAIGLWIDKFHLDFFGGYITYFLAGWYIVHVKAERKKAKLFMYCMGLLSLLFIIIYVWFTGDYGNAYLDISAPVFVYSVSLFLALNNMKCKLNGHMTGKIEKLSRLAFGVYIIHAFVLELFCKVMPYGQHLVLYIALCFAAVTCGSFLCAYIISKIPLMKRLIRA